ncbi:hypothetical protein BN1723_016902, partial [Verticillium longisporum]
AKRVKEWKIPSLEQAKKEEKQEKQYMKSVTVWRRIRAYWAVHGPEICFLALVIGMQLAFGIWQLVKYQTTPAYRAAFGWGVVMAKTCAGALYPTFFFLILSMSRYFSTFMRKSYYVSRFFNWDLSQEFHIRISCVAILLATLHALGHLTGSFSEIEVGINGPFGAPAQRFYEFNHSVIIGAGIGVTPFSGILADLQAHDDMSHGGPAHLEAGHLQDRHDSDATAADPADASGKFEKITGGDGMLLGSDEAKRRKAEDCSSQQDNNETRPENDEFVNADTINTSRRPEAGKSRDFADDYRRVDFHWMVRDRNYLSWLSDLLNEVSRSQEWHREHEDQPHLDIRIQTHVTAKRKDIVTHIYRWLLEMHRTDDHPASPCIGNKMQVHIKTDGDWTGRLRKLGRPGAGSG